eukprot:3555666-Prymnesium_polylepis.1
MHQRPRKATHRDRGANTIEHSMHPAAPPAKPHTSPIRAARWSGSLRSSRALQRREHDDH